MLQKILISLIVFVFASCSGEKIDVKLTVNAKFNENEMQVTGSTNLPDNAMIFINLKPTYEDTSYVKDGKIEHFFTFNGNFLPEGDYTLEVIFDPKENTESKIKHLVLLKNKDIYEMEGRKYFYIANKFTLDYLVSDEELHNLIGSKVPYNKWSEWGNPETLEQSTTYYWAVYLPEANISFISIRNTDTIIYANRGKKNVISFFEERDKKIKDSFSAWDGSHISLTKTIKENMHNPKSYEHVQTVYWDKGDYLIVKTDFRGANAFGGIVLNSISAQVSLEGEVLRILE